METETTASLKVALNTANYFGLEAKNARAMCLRILLLAGVSSIRDDLPDLPLVSSRIGEESTPA